MLSLVPLQGYFQSRNCLRELRACVDFDVPIKLVHEAERSDNASTMTHFIDECNGCESTGVLPPGTTSTVFNNAHGEPLRWLRNNNLQIETFKALAKALLEVSPKYAPEGRNSLLRSHRSPHGGSANSMTASSTQLHTVEVMARAGAATSEHSIKVHDVSIHVEDAGDHNLDDLDEDISGLAVAPTRPGSVSFSWDEQRRTSRGARDSNRPVEKEKMLDLYLKGEISHLGGAVLPHCTWHQPPTVLYIAQNDGIDDLVDILQKCFPQVGAWRPPSVPLYLLPTPSRVAAASPRPSTPPSSTRGFRRIRVSNQPRASAAFEPALPVPSSLQIALVQYEKTTLGSSSGSGRESGLGRGQGPSPCCSPSIVATPPSSQPHLRCPAVAPRLSSRRSPGRFRRGRRLLIPGFMAGVRRPRRKQWATNGPSTQLVPPPTLPAARLTLSRTLLATRLTPSVTLLGARWTPRAPS